MGHLRWEESRTLSFSWVENQPTQTLINIAERLSYLRTGYCPLYHLDQFRWSEELREKTLDDERQKTDEHLEQKTQEVEEKTSEKLRSIRLATDKARESQREEVDLAKNHQREVTGISPTRLDEKLVVQEREGSDKSQAVERGEEDRVRTEERVQKQLIAETEVSLKKSLSSNSKCNTSGPEGLRCCHGNKILSTHECGRT